MFTKWQTLRAGMKTYKSLWNSNDDCIYDLGAVFADNEEAFWPGFNACELDTWSINQG